MADVTVTIDTKKLDELIRTNPGKIAEAVGKTAFRILKDARIITPRRTSPPPGLPQNIKRKVSGELRANSDVVKVDTTGLVQNVEYYQVYAAAQELGRPEINLPARPFLTPATEKAMEQFVKDIEKAVNSG